MKSSQVLYEGYIMGLAFLEMFRIWSDLTMNIKDLFEADFS